MNIVICELDEIDSIVDPISLARSNNCQHITNSRLLMVLFSFLLCSNIYLLKKDLSVDLSTIRYARYIPYETPHKLPTMSAPIFEPSKAKLRASTLISRASVRDSLFPLMMVTCRAIHPTFNIPAEPPTIYPAVPPISDPYDPPLNAPTAPQNIPSPICCHSAILGADIRDGLCLLTGPW